MACIISWTHAKCGECPQFSCCSYDSNLPDGLLYRLLPLLLIKMVVPATEVPFYDETIDLRKESKPSPVPNTTLDGQGQNTLEMLTPTWCEVSILYTGLVCLVLMIIMAGSILIVVTYRRGYLKRLCYCLQNPFSNSRSLQIIEKTKLGGSEEELGLIPNECMRSEIQRLGSFTNWPNGSPVFPTHLARSGFFYKGNGNEVECFRCQGKITDWTEGDKPHAKHTTLFPNCPLVTGTDDTNLPLVRPHMALPARLIELLLRARQGWQGMFRNSYDHTAADGQMERSRDLVHLTDLEGNGELVSDADCLPMQMGCMHGNSGEATNTCGPAMPDSCQGSMKEEKNRIATFSQWPKRDLVNPNKLSAAGLYFVGPGDKVKCAFCEGSMMNWDNGDNPREEHVRYFGDRCPFVRDEPCGNVPLPDEDREDLEKKEQIRQLEQLGIVTDRPSQPMYARESDRLATFENWPKDKSQSPEMLAEAGFFYTGEGDKVRCFFCDGGFRSWEPSDDPWIEHARWFPKCGFVRQTKGVNFIQEAKRKAALENEMCRSPNESNNDGHQRAPPGTKEELERMVTAEMDSEPSRVILKMGFTRAQVESTIEKRLQTTGQPFTSPLDLLGVLVDSGISREAASTSPADPWTGPATGQKSGRNKFNKRPLSSENDNGEGETSTGTGAPEDPNALAEKNRRLRNERLCKICMDHFNEVVFLPCGHLVACAECAPRLTHCPVCRVLVRATVKAIF